MKIKVKSHQNITTFVTFVLERAERWIFSRMMDSTFLVSRESCSLLPVGESWEVNILQDDGFHVSHIPLLLLCPGRLTGRGWRQRAGGQLNAIPQLLRENQKEWIEWIYVHDEPNNFSELAIAQMFKQLFKFTMLSHLDDLYRIGSALPVPK